jgi:hypothetical protein
MSAMITYERRDALSSPALERSERLRSGLLLFETVAVRRRQDGLQLMTRRLIGYDDGHQMVFTVVPPWAYNFISAIWLHSFFCSSE